jgi:tetratricopeptide (TPR) repeat protein
MRKRLYKIERYWISSGDNSKECYPSSIALRKAEVLVMAGMWDQAVDLYRQVLAAGERWGADPERAESLLRLGDTLRLKSEYPAALDHLSQAMQLYRGLKDEGGAAKAAGAMGGVYGEQGDYQKAVECFCQRKDWAEKNGNKMELGIAWGNLGVIYAEQKMLDQALDCYRRQKELAQEIGDQIGVSLAEGNSGNMYLYKGEYDTAIVHLQRQMDLAAKIGDKRTLCAVTCNLGLLFKRQAKLEQSLEYLQKAMKAAAEIGYLRVLSLSYGNMGGVFQHLGDWDQASKFLNKHLEMSREMNDRPWMVTALANLSKIEEILGHHQEARRLIAEAVGISKENSLGGLLPTVMNMMGEILLEQGSYTEVVEIAGIVSDMAGEKDDPEQSEVARMLGLVARLGQGDLSAVADLKKLAQESHHESIRLNAGMEIYRHTGEGRYLEISEELSQRLYAQTRDIEYRIKYEQLRDAPVKRARDRTVKETSL